MSKKDYYETLGISKTATESEIKNAYRKLAKQYHPDVNKEANAVDKFKEATEAYENLSDAGKRKQYDTYGHSDTNSGNGFSGFRGNEGFSEFGDDVFKDLFGDLFGGGRNSSRKQSNAENGADLKYDTELTLEQMFNGVEISVEYTSKMTCEACKGSCGAEGSKPITCSTCNGQGAFFKQQGPFRMQQTCHACRGQGTTISKPCTKCNGNGYRNKSRKLSVKIPAGINDGERVRVKNEGEGGIKGGQAGDLFVEVQSKKHKFFTRERSNLFCEATVSFVTATLGGIIKIPSIDGTEVSITLPAGTQNGSQFKVSEHGMKMLQSTKRGDLYVNIAVEVPVKLTSKQRELLEQFEKESTNDSNPKTFSFFKKAKQFWSDLNKE